MARRRMFSLDIIDTDVFIDMPVSTQNLYFHLAMRADDDGFVSSPKKIIKTVNAADDDYKVLLAKKFLIPFDTGICVITHWRIHNYIQSDRYKPSLYINEKEMLIADTNGTYRLDTKCIQDGYKPDTQVRLGEDRLVKARDKESVPASPPFSPEPSTFKMPWDDDPIHEPKKAKPVTTAPGAGSQRIEAARQIWNTTDGLPQYRYLAVSIPPDKSGPILRMMGAYADDDIYKAIANYADILGRTDLEAFPRYTGFPGFMATGVEAYCDDAKPYERCKKRATPERYSKPGALDDRPDAMTSADIERMQRETDSEEYAEISAEMFAGKTPA